MARGFRKVEGVDYFETFAPTPASSCVQLLDSIAYELDLDLCHLDANQYSSNLTLKISMRFLHECDDPTTWMVWTVGC